MRTTFTVLLVGSLLVGLIGSPAGAQASPATDIAGTPSGKGAWTLFADGTVETLGDAPDLGDFEAITPSDFVATAATPSGKGLWGVHEDGAVETLGDAPDLGDGSADASFVGIAPTPSGKGYRLLVETGEVQGFGDAFVIVGGPPPDQKKSQKA